MNTLQTDTLPRNDEYIPIGKYTGYPTPNEKDIQFIRIIYHHLMCIRDGGTFFSPSVDQSNRLLRFLEESCEIYIRDNKDIYIFDVMRYAFGLIFTDLSHKDTHNIVRGWVIEDVEKYTAFKLSCF